MLDVVDPPAGAMKDLRVIFLNGPPRSGKDTAGHAIKKHISNADVGKFAGPLKRSVHADVGLPNSTPIDAFEDCKDDPSLVFFGMSPRQAYIYKSEKIMKPHFGDDVYGRLFMRSAWRSYQLGTRLIGITDSGFAGEAGVVINYLGAGRCMLMRIHADQRGKTFAGDSRTYISLPGIMTVDVDNQVEGPEGLAEFEATVVDWAKTLTWVEA